MRLNSFICLRKLHSLKDSLMIWSHRVWGMSVMAQRCVNVSLHQCVCVCVCVCVCHATLCLLLLLLCVEAPEQWAEKSRKMPSGSGSESKDSRTWSIMISGLDAGLGPELVSWASMREDAEEPDTSEPVQCVSSTGDGSGRMQGEWCWGWRGLASLGWESWLEVTVSAAEFIELNKWMISVSNMISALGDAYWSAAVLLHSPVSFLCRRLAHIFGTFLCSLTVKLDTLRYFNSLGYYPKIAMGLIQYFFGHK